MKLEEAIENTKKRINAWENIAEIGKATLSKEEYENSQSICEEQKLFLEELEHLQKENEELKEENNALKEEVILSAGAYKEAMKEQQRYYEERME